MTSETRNPLTRLAAPLLVILFLPAYAWAGASFKDHDTNKDGYLSLSEFESQGKDDLAFKAADINGDERVDPEEFDKYLTRKATDTRSRPDAAQPGPMQSPPGE